MKKITQLLTIACFLFGAGQQVKAQTILYSNDFNQGSDLSGWSRSGVEWRDEALRFYEAGGVAITPAIIPEGATHMSLSVTAKMGSNISLYTSSDKLSWESQGTLTSYHQYDVTTQKKLPDGTRYLRFVANALDYSFDVRITALSVWRVKPVVDTVFNSDTVVWNGTADTAFAGGTGTKEDPFLISSGAQFAYIHKYMTEGNPTKDKYFLQTVNIDMNNSGPQIGSGGFPFKGNFNGGGYKILNIGRSIFVATDSATIYNVQIASGSIELLSYDEINAYAALASTAANTTFAYCVNAANIERRAIYCGGIVGASKGGNVFAYCTNSGRIYNRLEDGNKNFYSYTGGIVGGKEASDYQDSLLYCTNTGVIDSRPHIDVANTSTIAYAYAGGISGISGIAVGCSNFGKISIAGYIQDEDGYGAIRGYAGGIIGLSGQKAENCFNRGDVSAAVKPSNSSNARASAGGIIGSSNGVSCYNTGNVSATGGYSSFNLINPGANYLSTIALAGTVQSAGTPRTAAELKTLVMNSSWTTDSLNINNGFPVLVQKSVIICQTGINDLGRNTLSYGDLLNEPEHVPNEIIPYGRRIACWQNESGKVWSFETDRVRESVTRLYPSFVLNEYKLCFNSMGGGKIDTQNVLCSSFTDKPDDPVISGYAFYAWYKDKEFAQEWNFITDLMPDHDVTLYARYKLQPVFMVNGTATTPNDYFLNEPMAVLPTPVRNGYTFVGWIDRNKHFVDTNMLATAELDTLWASWQINVKFNTMGGDTLNTKTYLNNFAYGESVNIGLPTPVKEGYIFGSWYAEPRYDDPRVNSDIVPLDRTDTFYAQWGEPMNVVFNPMNDSMPITKTYFPYRAYNANFTADGTACNTGFPANPAKPDAIFTGWYTDPIDPAAEQLNASDLVNEDVAALYARYIYKQTISFETYGGSTIEPRIYFPEYAYSYYGNGVSNQGLPANPTKTNAHFLGWYETPDFSGWEITNTSTVAANVSTLYAKWSERVTITFEVNGGNPVPQKDGLYFNYAYYSSQNSYYSLPVPVKTDAKFLGWYDTPDFSEGEITNNSTVDQYRTTLYAKWSSPITVHFETNGGDPISPKPGLYFDFAYNSSANGNYNLPTPNKNDARFQGWYDTPDFSEGQITSNSLVNAERNTLHAKWSEKITVNFETNGGDPISPKEGLYFDYAYYSSQNSYYSLPVPNKTDARFMGWYDTPDFSEGEITRNSLVNAGRTTLYAKWSEKITLNFEVNGGDAIAPKSGLYFDYAYNSSQNGNYNLPTPTKANAKFLGWYDTPDFSEGQITSTSLVNAGRTTLYAKWSDAILIAFEPNNGTSIASKTYYPEFMFSNSSYGNTGLPATPSKDSAYFVGWYDTPDFSGAIITNSTSVSPTMSTLYARWAEKVNVVFIDYSQDKHQTKSFWHSLPYNYNVNGKNTGLPTVTSPSSPNVAWYHDIVGLDDKVQNETPVPDRHTMLFAQWCVLVSFESNGGIAIADRIYSPNMRYNQMPNEGLPVPFRNGFGFEGWYSDAALALSVGENDIVYDGAHTLYAKWKEAPATPTKFTVTLVQSGGGVVAVKNGSFDVVSGTALDSATVLTLQAAPNAGYKFVKWHDNDTNANRQFVLNTDVTISATFEEITSAIIDQATEEGLKIYPNPVNDELVITNYDWKQGDRVELFDMNGKRVYLAKPQFKINSVEGFAVQNSEFKINMSSFKTGIYLLRISNSSGVVSGEARVVKM